MTINMAVLKPKQLELIETTDAWWQAVEQRDASRDGAFVYAVTSTGVFCRPSSVDSADGHSSYTGRLLG